MAKAFIFIFIFIFMNTFTAYMILASTHLPKVTIKKSVCTDMYLYPTCAVGMGPISLHMHVTNKGYLSIYT